ncbi:PREDICTED: zinc finger protein 235-like [Cyphomyrmex costatus]|uniref:zinc finger protein 235-like n=1 Tax=Cyphomyrmex costatus TaxID=456900 RepID=UPI000852461C|nr:PREDICTED: zinc finger protein 235-like [Cyphomyrmex costatus]
MNQNEETDNDTKDVHQQRNDRSNSPTTSNQENRNIHKIRPHVCKTCNKGFQSKADLSRHDRIHKNEKPYKCDICGHMTRTKGNLISHMVSMHKKDERFKSNKDLYTGWVSYTCRTCNKEFKNKYNLRIHERIHNDEKPYKCDICGHMTSTKGNLSSHILAIHNKHTGGKSYKCGTCNKEFKNKYNLRIHERIHNDEKPYKCDICGHMTRSKYNLSAHILAMHFDDERFKSNRHLYTVGKSYKCGTCHKEFKGKWHFNRHVKTHTGEKPYQCKLCEFKCSQKENLTSHVKSKHRNDERLKSNKDVYTGGVSYKCETCNNEFKSKAHLHIHERTHIGEKPYHCEFCGDMFRWVHQVLNIKKKGITW